MSDKYTKAKPPNECAHLVQGPDAEGYRAGDLKPIGTMVNWWCCWGETIDTTKMPRWASSHIDAGGPNFEPRKHCKNCPAYAPLSKGEE